MSKVTQNTSGRCRRRLWSKVEHLRWSFLRKCSQKSYIVNIWLGSKYASRWGSFFQKIGFQYLSINWTFSFIYIWSFNKTIFNRTSTWIIFLWSFFLYLNRFLQISSSWRIYGYSHFDYWNKSQHTITALIHLVES